MNNLENIIKEYWLQFGELLSVRAYHALVRNRVLNMEELKQLIGQELIDLYEKHGFKDKL